MRARYVRDDVVHYGNRVDTADGSRVYFLCEHASLLGAFYGGPGHDRLPMYEPGVEVFYVLDDVDCMTCLVAEARKVGAHERSTGE